MARLTLLASIHASTLTPAFGAVGGPARGPEVATSGVLQDRRELAGATLSAPSALPLARRARRSRTTAALELPYSASSRPLFGRPVQQARLRPPARSEVEGEQGQPEPPGGECDALEQPTVGHQALVLAEGGARHDEASCEQEPSRRGVAHPAVLAPLGEAAREHEAGSGQPQKHRRA